MTTPTTPQESAKPLTEAEIAELENLMERSLRAGPMQVYGGDAILRLLATVRELRGEVEAWKDRAAINGKCGFEWQAKCEATLKSQPAPTGQAQGDREALIRASDTAKIETDGGPREAAEDASFQKLGSGEHAFHDRLVYFGAHLDGQAHARSQPCGECAGLRAVVERVVKMTRETPCLPDGVIEEARAALSRKPQSDATAGRDGEKITHAADRLHTELLDQVSELMTPDPAADSPEGRRLKRLAELVEQYEVVRWPLKAVR